MRPLAHELWSLKLTQRFIHGEKEFDNEVVFFPDDIFHASLGVYADRDESSCSVPVESNHGGSDTQSLGYFSLIFRVTSLLS